MIGCLAALWESRHRLLFRHASCHLRLTRNPVSTIELRSPESRVAERPIKH
ncbi:hypothetical protein PMIN01_03816 [Paraphaeosphaeria minitans]|uniref:Uncharacterized protein n=1 Tax=Paraphaeosphaeria minitans TaxID=565426 RepID=A0A9P6KT65_9PLEO|nr:hypothetical protein PMIN01_03816 [Paraphaeosphaeria minitans]